VITTQENATDQIASTAKAAITLCGHSVVQRWQYGGKDSSKIPVKIEVSNRYSTQTDNIN
jgi:hypothetical protein